MSKLLVLFKKCPIFFSLTADLFYFFNLWRGIPLKNVTFTVENRWALSVKFILPLLPPTPVCFVFCAMTGRNPVSRRVRALRISSISFMLFVVKVQSVFLCLRWSVHFFLLPPVIVCVCVEVSVIFLFYFIFFNLFSALLPLLRCQYFIFSTCN